ncbi:DinB family protein [Pelagibius sp. Alg239-R121]|uniref:DinB family protein n=1 Tax=Pelagibius sp. Alg239-R121 TaxID=2993448 RepID=UPI0024A6804A|nr:DinB family protein [Pelagibius sp. Alg239-R121]
MLIRYKVWASGIAFDTVAGLPEEELIKERQTTFKTILHTLNHIYVVEDIFRAHLEGRQHGYAARNTETSPTLPALREASRNMGRWYIDLADSLTEDELSEIIEFEFVGGGAGAMARMEILYHIVNHATYHHGFVSDMLYQVPVRQPANDLPVFLRDVWNKN